MDDLDRFLKSNTEVANQKRCLEQEMNIEIARLMAQKETLTRHNVGVIASLTDSDRERQIQETISKLRSILAAITEQLGGEPFHMLCISPAMSDVNIAIDRRIEKLRTAVATIFDCPELQKYRVSRSRCRLCLHCSSLRNIV